MAEQIISPGVFTRENDLSFLPQGIGQIGAAIVGPTERGPAFVPTVVRSFADFERRFGPLSSETYVPQTAREYLKNAGSVTICRVLAGSGYTFTATTEEYAAFAIFPSGSNTGIITSVIFPSKFDGTPTLNGTVLANQSNAQAEENADIADNEMMYQTGSSYIVSGSTGVKGNIQLTLIGNSTTKNLVGSINPTDDDYIFNQIGYTPNNSKNGANLYTGTPGYTYINFKSLTSQIIATSALGGYGFPTDSINGLGSGSVVRVVGQSSTDLAFTDGLGDEKYNFASTPYIQSQDYSGTGVANLFRICTLDHGKDMARQYKISIANMKEPADIDGVEQYTQFSVIVRKFSDTDQTPFVLEQYNNVDLNPDSANYISRRIGDRYPQYNETLEKVELLGNYSNVSNVIRVEVDTAVDAKAVSPKLSPRGFAALKNPITTASLEQTRNYIFPSSSFEFVQQTGTDGAYSTKGFLGFKFLKKDADNTAFTRTLPASAETNVAGAFTTAKHFVHPSASITFKGSLSGTLDTTGTTGPTANELKFTVPFQGGDDGIAPYTIKQMGSNISNTNVYGFDISTTDAAGYKGYKKALDILSNQDEYDINMLVLPGIIKNHHSILTDAGIDFCETRGDAFYVMDLSDVDASVNDALNDVDGLDTNYAAVYYPWVKVIDNSRNKPILVPPSVIVPGAIAASDRIAAEWFAPAGLNRGVLGNVTEAKIRLSQAERDKLYNDKINPIATFPQTGVCIWGQKTLQSRSTALDRINVRRLLIALKKFIASSSKFLVFEQNTLQTRTRFLNIVNPYLESVQQRQGLFAFRVQMDESNNTPTVIDRNQLVGAIYLQPTRTAEFIVLDFNVMPTGATFDGGGSSGASTSGGGGGGGY